MANAEMLKNVPKIKMSLPDAAAAMMVAGIEKNRYRVLVGSDAKMMDFLCRLMPERAAKIIYTQIHSLLSE